MLRVKNLFWSLGFLSCLWPQIAFAILPGTVITDERNYWGHNGRLADPNDKSTYIVCDGYLGSPLIPNSHDAIGSFANNCENSPPPGSLPIIDVAENHSPNYKGYPAYPVKSVNSDRVYFLCDGFLNSTAWCSHEAHKKAQKLIRAAESKYWEPGETAFVIDDQPMFPLTRKSSTLSSNQIAQMPSLNEQEVKRLNIPSGSRVIPIDPSQIDAESLPEGAYIKAVPIHSQKKQFIAKPFSNYQNQNYLKPEYAQSPQTAQGQMVLTEDVKYFLVQAIENAVDKAFQKRGL